MSEQIQYSEKFKFRWQVGTDNSVVIGAHFQGKTYLSKYLIAKPLIGKWPLWIWDYHGKFADLLPHNVINHVSQLRYGTFVLRPVDRSPENFFAFCEMANKQANLHVIIDEAHNYCSAHKIDPRFAVLVRDKGNANVSYTCIFQRPAEIHKSIISNAKHRFAFRFDVPTDVQYLMRWLGTELELYLPPQQRRYYKEAPELPQYSFIYRDAEKIKPEVISGGVRFK